MCVPKNFFCSVFEYHLSVKEYHMIKMLIYFTDKFMHRISDSVLSATEEALVVYLKQLLLGLIIIFYSNYKCIISVYS